jgi:hypothetical protein
MTSTNTNETGTEEARYENPAGPDSTTDGFAADRTDAESAESADLVDAKQSEDVDPDDRVVDRTDPELDADARTDAERTDPADGTVTGDPSTSSTWAGPSDTSDTTTTTTTSASSIDATDDDGTSTTAGGVVTDPVTSTDPVVTTDDTSVPVATTSGTTSTAFGSSSAASSSVASDSSWHDLQSRFVDDPEAVVKEAGALVEQDFAALRTRLESGDTENLRTTFRRYRDLHSTLS